MDHHTWADPRHWRCLNLMLLVCLCLIRQHAAYPSMLIGSQVASEDSLDSRNQLDSLSRPPEEDEPEYKRSSAFFPLRGKKMTLDPELMPEDPDDKRSQFYPLRGKKVPEDLKRASYFMPMRGRKDDEAWREDLEKRMSSFMPMRGKKSVGDAFQRLGKPGTYARDIILYPSSSNSSRTDDRRNSTENRQKRSVAFMPMRGRRLEEDGPLGSIATSLLEKKMSSFVPMRGRRFPDASEDQSSNQSVHEDDLEEKRASSFMPMRGRKSSFSDYDFEEDKRGRPSFNAMRGRRGDIVLDNRDLRASSFMPMRGRRDDEDWTDEDKRMGFIPMRGRREDSLEYKRSQFMPMRGRRLSENETLEEEEDELLGGRGRRRAVFSPILVSSGIGSSLMSRHLFPVSAVRSAWAVRSRKVDWDSVKRGFHATRGKRLDGGCRCKRSLLRPHKQYIALKRPMSFFATRGKRMDSSSLDAVSKLR